MAAWRPPDHRTELSWSGWGDAALATPLPAALDGLLRQGLGVRQATPPPATIGELRLAPVRLPESVRSPLAAIVGEEHALGDHESRARHALGKSTLDLLAVRSGGPIPAPDMVLEPGSHDEILALLRLCGEHRGAVIPFGGGTSVVGGLTPGVADFAAPLAPHLP